MKRESHRVKIKFVAREQLVIILINCILTGPTAANKNVWLLGDVYLTDAAAVLSQMQMLNKDDLYLYQAYDVQSYFPKKQCTDTFGKQLRMALYKALEEHNRLPAVIIFVTGNHKIDNLVTTPYHTKRIWNALCNEIDHTIKASKNVLPHKCFLNEEPRVFFTNVVPRYKDHCDMLDEGFDSFKTKRRRLNNILPQILNKFCFEVLPIGGILTDQEDYFVSSTKLLSGKGMEVFWMSVSKELRLADKKLKENIKNKVIQSYHDDQNELARIKREKQAIADRRFSTSKPAPNVRYDRGDGPRGQDGRLFYRQGYRRGHSASR